MKSFLIYNPGCSLTLLTNNEPYGWSWDEISSKVELEYVDIEDASTHDGYQGESCLQRIRKLARDGGIYFDIDILFFNAIPNVLFSEELVMPQQPRSKILNNGFIMASKESSALNHLYNEAEKRANREEKFWCSRVERPDRREYQNIRVLEDTELIHRRPSDPIYQQFLFSTGFDPGKAFGIHWWNRAFREHRGISTIDLPLSGTAFAKYAEKIRQVKL